MSELSEILRPTIGRIVLYNTTEADRKFFEVARGNQPKQLPAVVVAVWSESTINLKVIGDGNHDLWKTSATQGTQEGNWQWPTVELSRDKVTVDIIR